MMICRYALLAIGLLASTSACDGESMTVGTEPAIGTTSAGFQNGQVWTGYVENYHFGSGSDRISIAFTSPTTGAVTLGALPTGPEVVDPDIGYPSSLWATYPGAQSSALRHYAESFPFTLREGSREGARLRFNIDVREMWKPWCQAQTQTYANGQGTSTWYNCLPNKDRLVRTAPHGCFLVDADGTETPVDCGKLEMCSQQVCTCNATSCDLTSGADIVNFDMRVNGSEADGSSDLGRIHLEKE